LGKIAVRRTLRKYRNTNPGSQKKKSLKCNHWEGRRHAKKHKDPIARAKEKGARKRGRTGGDPRNQPRTRASDARKGEKERGRGFSTHIKPWGTRKSEWDLGTGVHEISSWGETFLLGRKKRREYLKDEKEDWRI